MGRAHWLLLLLLGCTGGTDTESGIDRPDDDVSGDDVDSDTEAVTGQTVRVVCWNVQTLGNDSWDERDAVEQILTRIDADIVAINELDGSDDDGNLRDLAEELGYADYSYARSTPFGDLHNGFLSKHPIDSDTWHTSASLSGDSSANDITRVIGEVTVTIGGHALTVVTTHLKSGFEDADEYRRDVDALRAGQVVEGRDAIVLCGDMNYEIEDGVGSPSAFTSLPSDLPSSFDEGADVRSERTGDGLVNDPFHYLSDESGLEVLDLTQVDGREATRWESGRRLDYILLSSDLASGDWAGEVYDSTDEGQGGLDKSGDAPDRGASEEASDHLPVFVDLVLE